MPEWLPSFLTPQVITSVIVILLILHLALGAAAYLILLERKVCAWVQDRVGPNRVGFQGLLQPIADGLKLFMKEDFVMCVAMSYYKRKAQKFSITHHKRSQLFFSCIFS